MGSNHDHPVEVDPHALAESRHLWSMFTKATTFSVIVCVVVLGLMAFFLVG